MKIVQNDYVDDITGRCFFCDFPVIFYYARGNFLLPERSSNACRDHPTSTPTRKSVHRENEK